MKKCPREDKKVGGAEAARCISALPVTQRRQDRKHWVVISLAQIFIGNKKVEGLKLVSGLDPSREKRGEISSFKF